MYILVMVFLSFLASTKAAVQGRVAKTMKTSADNLLFNSLSFIAIVIVYIAIFGIKKPSTFTVICAAAFGIASILFQFAYTNAFKNGPISLTVFINAFHLVFPIILSAFVYSEMPKITQYIGLVFIICSLYFIFLKKDNSEKTNINAKWLISVFIATLCSGCAVSSQKIHQYSVVKDEYSQFMILANIISAILSIAAYTYLRFAKNEEQNLKVDKKLLFYAGLVGVILGAYDGGTLYLNGILPSVILTPTLNTLSILTSTLFGILFFKEKLGKYQKIGFAFGIIAVILITV